MKKEFNELKLELILVNDTDIIKTSNEAYVSWWEEDQPEQSNVTEQ